MYSDLLCHLNKGLCPYCGCRISEMMNSGYLECSRCGCGFSYEYIMLLNLHDTEEHTEWVTVPCTSLSCRGRLRYGKGLSVTVQKGDEHRAICNECYCK